MALVLGTNCGFVTTAPTDDPAEVSKSYIDWAQAVQKDTSPVTAGKIVEVGWWCDTATQAANFEVGLYAANGATIPGEAGTLLEVSRTNAKGTTAGWKVKTGLNWTISSDTIYWIGVQLDDTATQTNIDLSTTNGIGCDILGGKSTLSNPFGGEALEYANRNIAIYAVWEVAAAGTNIKINIGDTFKDVAEIKINIGDVWKPVTSAVVNVGDVWKTIF